MTNEHSHLIKHNPNEHIWATDVSKNVRREMKFHFPKKKAQVKLGSSRNSIHVVLCGDWTPEEIADVKKLVSKFQHGHFDGMTDCYEYSKSDFNRVYGGISCVFVEKEWV